MKRFAKLFTTKNGTQLLITDDGIDCDEHYRLTFRTEHLGCSIEASLIFKDKATAIAQFDEFTASKALALRKNLIDEPVESDLQQQH